MGITPQGSEAAVEEMRARGATIMSTDLVLATDRSALSLSGSKFNHALLPHDSPGATVTFEATLVLSMAAFEMLEGQYVFSVAAVASVLPSAISISLVTELVSTNRRLMAESVVVKTMVATDEDSAGSVSLAIQQNLASELESVGIE
eukprot:2517184-Rhodomonas_salina.1